MRIKANIWNLLFIISVGMTSQVWGAFDAKNLEPANLGHTDLGPCGKVYLKIRGKGQEIEIPIPESGEWPCHCIKGEYTKASPSKYCYDDKRAKEIANALCTQELNKRGEPLGVCRYDCSKDVAPSCCNGVNTSDSSYKCHKQQEWWINTLYPQLFHTPMCGNANVYFNNEEKAIAYGAISCCCCNEKVRCTNCTQTDQAKSTQDQAIAICKAELNKRNQASAYCSWGGSAERCQGGVTVTK